MSFAAFRRLGERAEDRDDRHRPAEHRTLADVQDVHLVLVQRADEDVVLKARGDLRDSHGKAKAEVGEGGAAWVGQHGLRSNLNIATTTDSDRLSAVGNVVAHVALVGQATKAHRANKRAGEPGVANRAAVERPGCRKLRYAGVRVVEGRVLGRGGVGDETHHHGRHRAHGVDRDVGCSKRPDRAGRCVDHRGSIMSTGKQRRVRWTVVTDDRRKSSFSQPGIGIRREPDDLAATPCIAKRFPFAPVP